MTAGALPELEMPFPCATGRGVKIAVIDSGVNVAHPHITARIQPVFLNPANEERSVEDNAGHGTAVMAAIQEKAPDAEYFVIKLFSRSLRTSAERLIEAIEWSIENRMNLVNLSLGTSNPSVRRELQELAARAQRSDVLLVSARSHGLEPTFPGAFPEVMGVDVDLELPRQRYRLDPDSAAPHFIASGYPRSLPGMHPQKNIHGISFAVANMTGFAARACELAEERTFTGVCEALKRESLRLQIEPLIQQ